MGHGSHHGQVATVMDHFTLSDLRDELSTRVFPGGKMWMCAQKTQDNVCTACSHTVSEMAVFFFCDPVWLSIHGSASTCPLSLFPSVSPSSLSPASHLALLSTISYGKLGRLQHIRAHTAKRQRGESHGGNSPSVLTRVTHEDSSLHPLS